MGSEHTNRGASTLLREAERLTLRAHQTQNFQLRQQPGCNAPGRFEDTGQALHGTGAAGPLAVVQVLQGILQGDSLRNFSTSLTRVEKPEARQEGRHRYSGWFKFSAT